MDNRQLLALINLHERNALGSSSSATNIATQGTTSQYGAVDVERAQAMDYYHGRPLGNEVEGRSQVVSQEVRDTIEWAMPQIMRMFVSSKTMVRFDPEGPQDEAEAQQVTDGVNYVMMRQNNGTIVLHDFFKDALMLKNGYVKVYYEKEDVVQFDNYTGLSPDALTYIVGEIEKTGDKADIAAQETLPDQTLSVRIKRTTKRKRYKLDCIATEDMRIAPDTGDDLQASAFVAHVVRKTRSEWKALGYDVASEPADNSARINIQQIARSDTVDELSANEAGSDKSMEIVEGLECYMRVDWDGDGYAELRKVLKAPGKIVSNEPLDEIPIAYCVPIRMPHRHLGISVADMVSDIQRIKTSVLRQGLDNLYLSNNPQKVLNEQVVNIDDALISRPGGLIRATDINQIRYEQAPFVFPQAVAGLEYMDSVRENRTGVNNGFTGVDSAQLTNIQPGTVNQLSSMAAERVVQIARILAFGIEDLFSIIHEQVLKMGHKRETMQLAGKWVEVDPGAWKKRTSFKIAVAFAAGNKDAQIGR